MSSVALNARGNCTLGVDMTNYPTKPCLIVTFRLISKLWIIERRENKTPILDCRREDGAHTIDNDVITNPNQRQWTGGDLRTESKYSFEC